MIKNKKVNITELGLLSYDKAWKLQEEYFTKTISVKRQNRNEDKYLITENHILFVEHPPVFTLGKSGKIEHLLLEKQALKAKGISFFKTNRGGDITYHGPGQLVGYPILDLDNFFTDIHKYLRYLEEVIIRTLSDFGIKGSRSDGETGVWLDLGTPFARKICALGVRASRWVTMHGFALNINTDLSYYEYIVPCGIKGKGITSLSKELMKEVNPDLVKASVINHFSDIFEAEIIS